MNDNEPTDHEQQEMERFIAAIRRIPCGFGSRLVGSIAVETLVALLVEKGIITRAEYVTRLANEAEEAARQTASMAAHVVMMMHEPEHGKFDS